MAVSPPSSSDERSSVEEAELSALSLKLEKVKGSVITKAFELLAAIQKDKNEMITTSNNAYYEKEYLKRLKDLNPTTKALIETLANDLNRSGLSESDTEKAKKELAGNPVDIFNYLKKNSSLTNLFKQHLSALEQNKANAKWWIDWVVEPFKSEGFIGGTAKVLSELPPPFKDIFDDIENICDTIRQTARLKAMQYDPDMIGSLGMAQKEATVRGVGVATGAIGKTAALAGLIIGGLALAPIAAAIAGFAIAIGETVTATLAIKTLVKDWTVEQSKQYPGRRFELVANVIKPVGKAIVALTVGIAAVASTVVGLPIMAAVGATAVFISSATAAISEGAKLVREWGAKAGEKPAETRARRLNNINHLVNKLAVTVFTAVLAIAAIALVSNPVGLAVIAGGLVIAGVAAMAVSFATFIAPKIPAIISSISNWWNGKTKDHKPEKSDQLTKEKGLLAEVAEENKTQDKMAVSQQDKLHDQAHAALIEHLKDTENKLEANHLVNAEPDVRHAILPKEKSFVHDQKLQNQQETIVQAEREKEKENQTKEPLANERDQNKEKDPPHEGSHHPS
jgi:hypothetical protein